MRIHSISTIVNTICLQIVFIPAILIGQNQISFSVISSGGEKLSNANYGLIGTVGEVFVGKSINTTHNNYLGFWYLYEQDIIDAIEYDEFIPIEFKLEQNFPNPFNPSTIIRFGIPERSYVLLKIYDLLGRELMTIINEEMAAGWYNREFNATSYASGIYIFRIQAGPFIRTKKMILVK